MHAEAYAYVAWAATQYGCQAGPTFEIGSRNINGSVRPLFTGTFFGVDLHPGKDVDFVGDAVICTPSFVPKVVVCCEVLEHAENAEAICQHAASLLPKNGYFIVTAAGPDRVPHSGVDGGPLREHEYYQNVTTAMLTAWTKGLKALHLAIYEDDIRGVFQKMSA